MNTDTAPPDAFDLRRGGFWRRWLATLVDIVVVMLPFQVLAAVLFNMTAGMVQMDSGFYRFCAPAPNIPQSLNPAPPHESNYATVCRVSLFGATTGAFLIVGRVTREGNTTTNVNRSYLLGNDGAPISGISIDWIAQLALLVYIVGMIRKTGRTVGGRIVGLRVIDAVQPGAHGVPIHKVIIRYLAMVIGFVPMFAVLIYQFSVAGGDVDAIFTGNFFLWFMAACAVAVLYEIVLIIQIAMKKDPIYDRLAGTAVVIT